MPGREEERNGVALHEISHLKGKATDGSVAFEISMAQIMGKLATAYLRKGKRL